MTPGSTSEKLNVPNGVIWVLLGAALLVAGDLVRTRVIAIKAVAAVPDRPMPWHFGDLFQLYSHTEIIRSGHPLYWQWPDFTPAVLRTGVAYPLGRMPYPPFLTPALTPLAAQGLPALAIIWYALIAAALLAYACSLSRLLGRSGWRSVVVALAVVLVCPGTYGALYGGNVEPILWALVGLALLYPRWRGPGFALIALVKVWGVWPLAWAAKRRPRVLLGAALTAAASTATSALVLGPGRFVSSCLDWIRYMLPLVSQGYWAEGNVSLSFAMLRLSRLAGWTYTGGPLPPAARVWLLTASIGAPLLAGWQLRNRDERAQLAGVMVATVLAAPVCWLYYVPGLLAPLAVWCLAWKAPFATPVQSERSPLAL